MIGGGGNRRVDTYLPGVLFIRKISMPFIYSTQVTFVRTAQVMNA